MPFCLTTSILFCTRVDEETERRSRREMVAIFLSLQMILRQKKVRVEIKTLFFYGASFLFFTSFPRVFLLTLSFCRV